MGVTLLLAALLAQAPEPAEQPAPAPVVAELSLRLATGSNRKLLEGVADLVLVRTGQPLSIRAVRRSIERLMETGRYADVEVFAEDYPEAADAGPPGGRIRVVFEISPRQLIGAVYFEGASALPESELLVATRLAPDSEFYPERGLEARDALLAAYRRRGYREARVEVRAAEGEAGVDVGFFIEEGLPTRLKAVVVAGDPGLAMPRLMRELGLVLDEVIDLAAVEVSLERLKALLREEHFYRARVDAPQVEESGLLVLPIVAGPRIDFDFIGNNSFAASALTSVFGWDGEEVLDRTVEDRLAYRLATFYRYRGFHDVRVTVEERPGATARSLRIRFAIDEGRRLVVNKVVFEGTKGITADELRGVLADVVRATAPDPGTDVHPLTDPLQLEGRMKQPRFGDLPSPAPETVLVESAYAEAASAMGRLYRERGYLKASVVLQQIDFGPLGAEVRFSVDEGPQTLLRRVEFTGGPPGFPDSSAGAISVGAPFSDRRLEQWRLALARELSRKGFLYGTIESEVRLDETGTQADLTFLAVPGPQVTVGKVLVRGNLRTSETVVLDQLAVKEGEALDPEALFTSQRNLLGLGIFRSVDVRILTPEARDAVKDVVVEVRERSRLSGEFGLGYFLAEGPRIIFDAEYPNIAGRAINLQARARLNFFGASAPALSGQVDVSDLNGLEQFGWRGNLSASNRGLIPGGVGARIDLVGERVFRQSYRFTRFAAIPGFDWSHAFTIPQLEWTRPKLTLQLQYELEWARVYRVNNPSGLTFTLLRSDQERLRFLFGTFALQTVRFAPTIDLRDDAVVPTRGLLVQMAAEGTFPVETRDENDQPVPVQFVKLSGTVSGYVPVWRKVVLALSLRGGKVFPLTQGSVTPPVKRFFLGGSSSMRGFREDGLIADDQRREYEREVADCRALATDIGCTPAARTLLAGREVASQGGELFTLGKAELRFPAFGAFDVGVFVEAGNLWLGPPTSFALRPVAGSGLRYVTPIGPLALDFGVNLAPDLLVNEPAFNVHFNIGLF